MFGRKSPSTYDGNLREVLRDVKGCQHLRFIGQIYRTKEVCLEALKAQQYYDDPLYDLHEVPLGNLEYVVAQLRILKKDDPSYLEDLEKNYKIRKARENEPGYYGEYPNFQAMLDHYGAVDCDDMYRKIFEKASNKK